MVHGKNRISYRIDRRLTGLAGPDYDANISFGLPLEPEDSQYGKSRLRTAAILCPCSYCGRDIALVGALSSQRRIGDNYARRLCEGIRQAPHGPWQVYTQNLR